MNTATILRTENIPGELKALRQWVVWKWENRDGKPTKPPRSAHTGALASSTDPKTWAAFDDAEKRHEYGGYAGIGFVLTEDDPYVGIDLDHCRETDTGTIEPWALEIVQTLDSYTEVSPSGTGLRIFVRGSLPDRGRKKGNVEMYTSERYLTTTGDHLERTPHTIEERSEELTALHTQVFGVEEHHDMPASKSNLNLSDEEIIEKARRAKNGAEFERLWNGDTTGYESQSEAELALCSKLAFWTGRDRDRMDRLVRSSGLFREKWDSPRSGSTYGGLTIDKVLSKPGDTYSQNGSQPPDFIDADEALHLADLGNAKRLVRDHGDDLRHVTRWDRWQVWDGRRFAEDGTREVYRRAKSSVLNIYKEAAATTEDSARTKIATHATKSESQGRIEAMLGLATSEEGVPVRPDELDADPWLFNVQNGTIDVRTGEMRPHDRADLMTKLSPVKYDPDATAPVFASFLNRIMGGVGEDDIGISEQELIDKAKGADELIEYLQKTLGRALTGDVSEHRLELWHGAGANGKSTLINAMLDVMGDYGKTAAPGLLVGRYADRHPTEVADLLGARFVSSVEIGENRKLAEELVKRLTGGDKLKARLMRQDFWEFDATHKLFVSCNHRPTIKGSDHAIWRRVKLVPFAIVIPEEQQDKELGAKLKRERSGILNWLIEGCLAWQRDGLKDPEAVTAATADYRAEQDVIASFIEDCCTTDENDKALAAGLYAAYTAWCKTSGEDPLSKRAFGLRLGDQGFTSAKGSAGKRWWFGIGLKAQKSWDSDTE